MFFTTALAGDLHRFRSGSRGRRAREFVLERDGGYPDVILGDRAAPQAQRVSDRPVGASGHLITWQDVGVRSELLETGKVLRRSCGLSRPEVELTERDRWHEERFG
jgi:hypothetical protein